MKQDELLDELTHAVDVVLHAEQQWPFGDWLGVAAVSAAGTLARHVQRLYDPTPVDGEWFVAIGGRRTAGGTWRIEHLEFWLSPNGPTLWNGSGWHNNPTRGDVRRLCDALGIELREEP